MASLLRLPARRLARTSITSSTGRITSLATSRSYAQDSKKSSGKKDDATRDAGTPENPMPNHPIPSNNAKPTLRDGRSSPIADFEGNLKDDVPEDVKKHNEDMDKRHDRSYNHITDDGSVKEREWENK
ncbi:uncharacterized protein N7473_008164 [Penicillium subrubescens]|jgi:hypothetical protein|uniref:Uncharacterized protein n=1 Tax=Penicillium subrubescens TaxID=1316194 RepID=A0A1Q5TF39_9EURO|nr:uncharacterized protein N7473_008164 [Penicillium subrubescens]KAJ5891936.1 hypothetical protein N7473_008164 [Penicillium subrubescens]OKO98840.1 hypothetical protein PENSUB_8757 [Penicillium subrubescens]